MEDESHKEIPSINHFYRPVRQMVYAILFNLHHHTYMATKSKDSKPGMLILAFFNVSKISDIETSFYTLLDIP